MTLQERYDELKQLSPKQLAARVPADCRPKQIPRRAVFVPNQPPHFSFKVTPGMKHVERATARYPYCTEVLEYIAAFDTLNGLKSVEYELISAHQPLQQAA